ncbi:hypothetical protein [Agromyces archimandritae]|uniref:Uncharacterized protein n=1 Tax=Agromyces archimandritae TaxID=2781962 RepID=A0A975FMB6_9MICO|nr:hypothetical protein [Agromyces archimandritae]QTX04123.1 hypothetical protein G127AT_12590 [Agromyces archimandritae]
MSEIQTPARPEYALLALHDDLIALADEMFTRAAELRSVSPACSDAALLDFAAAQTIAAADLTATARWSFETALSWLDAGRAAVKRARP